MRSLVRIHACAKQLGTVEYKQAVSEFIQKMGGTKKVVEEILSSTNTVDRIASEDDPIIAVHGESEHPGRSL